MDSFLKYQKYKIKYLNLKNSQLDQTGGNITKSPVEEKPEKPEMYLFKSDSCHYCKSFMGNWNLLVNDPKLNKHINFTMLDATNDKNEIKKWEITGYPTLILRKGDKTIEYQNERSVSELTKFLNKNTKNE
jgi:thiol-disulfide isomerase/thioredoxin